MTTLAFVAFMRDFGQREQVDVAYHRFASAPKSQSYIAWLDQGDTPMAADNRAYYSQPAFAIEVYHKRTRSFALEKKLEDALDAAKVYWSRQPTVHLEDEDVFMTVYNV